MKRDLIFLSIISALIVFIWFSSGKTIAGGEESFSVFNKMNIESQTSLWQTSGAGYPIPVYTARLTPAVFVKLLLLLNIQMFLIQTIFYFILILSGAIGVYFLTKEFFETKSITPFMAAIFYLLNLYSQTQIFGRFLYSGIAAWSFFPISLFLWIKWGKTQKLIWIFLFCLLSVVFSIAYLQPANIVTLWTPLVIWSCYIFFRDKRSTFLLIKSLFFFGLGIFFWTLVNIWWIFPYLKIGSMAFGLTSSLKGNMDSLIGVSKYFNTLQILLLRQEFLLGPISQFYSFYNNPLIYFVSIVVLGIAILGFIKIRKMRCWPYLAVLLFVGWFVSKGSNFPFGIPFFTFLFSKFNILTVLRNPYEKFGLVWLLPYSVFFALGVNYIKEKLGNDKGKIFVGFSFLFINIILVSPMVSGKIMENKQVSLPSSYENANTWLNNQKDVGRVLQVPLTSGNGMTYKWGYNGVEPSEYLFDRASISKIFWVQYFDEKYQNVVEDFNNDQNVEKDLGEMAIRYIVVHKDIDASVKWGDYKKSEEVIKNHPSIKLVANFGDLDIYKFENSSFNGFFELKGSRAGKISYQRINNRYYKVFVEDNQGSTNLIFKTTFNPLWEARIEGVQVPIHQVVYDYANEWDIEKTGSYTIDVKFVIWPWE